MGPLAMGLTLWAAIEAGGSKHDVSINPARLLGPAIVSACETPVVWLYLSAQLAGALLSAALYTVPFLGFGKFAPRRLPCEEASPPAESGEPLLAEERVEIVAEA